MEMNDLSQDELTLVSLIKNNYKNKQIAEYFNLSFDGAKCRVSKLFRKFEAANRLELIVKFNELQKKELSK